MRFVSQSWPVYVHCAHHFPGAGDRIGRVHGHTFVLIVSVVARDLDGFGRGVDLVELNELVRSVAEQLDHRDLNDMTAAPSMEWIAIQFARAVELRGWDLDFVSIEEPGIGTVTLRGTPCSE